MIHLAKNYNMSQLIYLRVHWNHPLLPFDDLPTIELKSLNFFIEFDYFQIINMLNKKNK